MKTTRFIKNALLIAILLIGGNISSQIIDTYAGDGTAGYSGDGSQATSANINIMGAVASDKSGNIYISDVGSNVIRKVDKLTGVITTVAGTGANGFSGDAGQATSANLNNPYGVALDTNSNIYIADCFNHRIRKVDVSTGIITTIAGTGTSGSLGDGGLATSAELNFPYGLTVGKNGDVYIADGMNYKIRKITASTGIISTIAGTGAQSYTGDGGLATSATMKNPVAVTLDSNGDIYFADQINSSIRKISVGTGIITTVVGDGTGVSGYSGDGGLATSAKINAPTGLSIDKYGNIYISEQANNLIRQVSPSGIITTLSGNTVGGYSGDGGLASSAQLSSPFGVTFSEGNLYVSDMGNYRVRKITLSSDISGTVNYSGGTANSGYVKLLGYSATSKMPMVDSVQISSGSYTFFNAPIGSYIVYADASGSLPNTAPTFADSTIYWDSAKVVVSTGAGSVTQDIKLVEVPTNVGSGSVSGQVTEGLNFGKMMGAGDPVGGVDVGIRKKPVKNLIAKTKTDANGNYNFGNLPSGSYDIYVSIAGLELTSTYDITITSNENITGEDFTADSATVYATGVGAISLGIMGYYDDSAFGVYPNPTSGVVNIILNDDDTYDASMIAVRNIVGQTVLQQSMTGVIGQTTIDITGMESGVYFVALTYNNIVVTKKIILE